MFSKNRFGLKIRKQNRILSLPIKNSPFYVKTGELIVVETNRGEEIGTAVKLPRGCEREHDHEQIKINHIVRQATEHDLQTLQLIEEKEAEYVYRANTLLKKQKLPVKIITGELLFNQKKLTLFYQKFDDKKIKPNFKQIGKELYQEFSLPVELQEASNRGEAKVLGGLGPCGKQLCCTTWVTKGKHVSIKMAKEQGMPINIPKISGQCEKLMCCLSYEHSQYENGKIPDISACCQKQDEDTLLEYARMFKEKEEEKNK